MLPILCMATLPLYAEELPPLSITISEETVPQNNPFTPDGQGTVLDNAHESDGKEFFTITTESEDLVFYLVIDRQRSDQNVYLLKPISETDLFQFISQPPIEETEKPIEEAVPRFTLSTAPTEPEATTPEEPSSHASWDLKHILAIAFAVLIVLFSVVASILKLIQSKKLKQTAIVEYDPEEDDEETLSDDDFDDLLK